MIFCIEDKENLGAQPGIRHGFFGRQGGVSTGLYESLNTHPRSGDDLSAVQENRARIAQAMGVVPEHLLTVDQCHSALCVKGEGAWATAEAPAADALVTDNSGYALGVMTADCAPVLLYGAKAGGAPVIAACHAGWQGAFKGVVASTVQAMADLGAGRDSLCAAIGPCIQQESYEVDAAFRDNFLSQTQDNACFFVPGARAGAFQFDLSGYVAERLQESGVPFVYNSGIDTYSDEVRYFSYRRATHRGESVYGRQISAIAISA